MNSSVISKQPIPEPMESINKDVIKAESSPSVAAEDNVVRNVEVGTLSDVSAETVTGKNGGAYLLFSLYKTSQSQIDIQRKDFQSQIKQQQADYLYQIDQFNLQAKKEFSERQKLLDAQSEAIVKLSVENGFCKSLTAINIIGSATTLIGTAIVGFVTPTGKWWLIVLGALITIIGSLLPQIVTWVSEIFERKK